MQLLGMLLTQALTLYRQGELQRAGEVCAEVSRAYPDNFDALHLHGVIATEQGDFPCSITLLERALKLKPASAPAHLHLGNVLRRTRQHERALDCYERATQLAPYFVEAWNNRGNALREAGRCDEALANLEKALALKPDDAEIHNNLGNVHRDLHQPDEALAHYDKAIQIAPAYAEAHNNRGFVLAALRRSGEALACYARAQQIYPDYARAHLNEALTRLLIGDYATGWIKYEWRWADVQRSGLRSFKQPLWHGQTSLADKTILVHPEQGYGDCIQFARYIPSLISMGARVVLEAPPELEILFAQIPGIQRVIRRGADLPAFDYHCPLASLPRVFTPDVNQIPANIPYLSAPNELVQTWSALLSPTRKKRIGLVWAGSMTDPLRAIPLQQLISILPDEFAFVCLQKDLRAGDADLLAAHPQIVNLGDALLDFAHTAAALSLLDGVISIDTSVAHLAGALGKPTLVPLHYSADWRYGLEATTTPWYPTMRLFRQTHAGHWDDVLLNIKSALLQQWPGYSIN
ncbi:MAG TPA: tetratricopeptide repeat-containing glycosyltransferase family protein [Rhodocyclaceae bacterium]|nr:tetratricopeptide repeat-containing glycosyltransferase family protein [Rhodocyclaceae bacterium]